MDDKRESAITRIIKTQLAIKNLKVHLAINSFFSFL